MLVRVSRTVNWKNSGSNTNLGPSNKENYSVNLRYTHFKKSGWLFDFFSLLELVSVIDFELFL